MPDPTRFIHVLDDMTDIKVMVFVPAFVDDTDARRVLRSAGFALDATPDPPNVVVTDLHSMRTEYNAFAWSDMTMAAFHQGITRPGGIDRLWALGDGASINVRDWRMELIRGREGA